VREIPTVLRRIEGTLAGGGDRSGRLRAVAGIVREAGAYRWVGIYDVSETEISLVAWSGPGPPAHPRFPADSGLCGQAVRARRTVVVGDVGRDPNYLPTLEGTRSEIVVPILDLVTGVARGTLDVESERLEAFGDSDRDLLEHCAAEIAAAESASPG
jgi:L-methionine (R)-S-oxide reductase